METSCATDVIVSRGSHHRSLNSDGLLVIALSVMHVGPDPQRALVVGTEIVTSDILLTIGVVVCLNSTGKSLISPCDRLIVDFSATVAIFITRGEVSELITTSNLNRLTRAELGLDLGGSNGVVSSIELVKLLVEVLRDSGCLECASLSGLLVASAIDERKMDWCN